MKNNNIRKITEIGIITALYVGLVLVVPAVSFGPIQFRVAEMLNFLVILNPLYAVGVTLGVFLSNFFSAYGVGLDLIFGTLHTVLSFGLCLLAFKVIKEEKYKYVAVIASFSILMCIIAFEIALIEQNFDIFWQMYGTLFLSELTVLVIGAFVMMKVHAILKKSQDR